MRAVVAEVREEGFSERLIHPEDYRGLRGAAKALATTIPFESSTRVRRKDGTYRGSWSHYKPMARCEQPPHTLVFASHHCIDDNKGFGSTKLRQGPAELRQLIDFYAQVCWSSDGEARAPGE